MSGQGSKSTKASGKQSFPDVERQPGYLSQWDTDIFTNAGLTPLTVLRDRFGHDYTALVGDAATLRTRMSAGEWKVILAKAERGGRYKLAKMLTEHGAKGDIATDFGAHRDTLSREEKLYDNLPWACPQITEEANKASSEGLDYVYNIDHIITVGKDAARTAGATRTAKPKYRGDGKVILIDPTNGTVELTDLPPGFPGERKNMPHWEQEAGYELQAGAQLWKEIVGNKKGYYLFDLPLKDSGKRVVFPLHERVLLLRVDRKKELLSISLSADALLNRLDFGAREPMKVDVLSIDPVTGKVERSAMMDNEIVASPDNKMLTALGEPFEGLSLMLIDGGSIFAFTIGGQRCKGRSFVVRLEPEGQWLAPLAMRLSTTEVIEHITFNTLQAAAKDAGEVLPIDPNTGFEQLERGQQYDQVWRDYFGFSLMQIETLLSEQLGSRVYDDFQKAGYHRRDGTKSLWNVAKLRALTEKAKADLAAAKADGFEKVDAATFTAIFGTDDSQERQKLVRQGLGLAVDPPQPIGKPLEDEGYLRRIAGTNLWKLQMLPELVERGRAKANEPAADPVVSDASDLIKPETDEAAAETHADEAEATETQDIDLDDSPMGDEERRIEAAKLLDEVDRTLGQLEQRAIGWLENFDPHGKLPLSGDVEFEEAFGAVLSDAKDVITEVADKASATKKPLARLTDYINVPKPESSGPVDVEDAIKRGAVRARPHLSVDDVLACYVQTPTGIISVLGPPEDTPADENEAVKRDLVRVVPDLPEAAIEILALYVWTLKAKPASEVETTQPSGGRRGRKRRQQPSA